ncbi:MAG TPA: ROK family transcriptional regulator [Solirubrobacteraceae bacterium]|nr:ROK family transcriptional regulator [Solirubrobacteraceae bacterium]
MGTESAPSGLANQRAVRRHNLGVVLRHLSEHGPRSRATIALETGLNKTTVSSLVTELIGLDLVVERGLEQRGTVGRPGQVVELSGEGVVALGLEINVDYLAVRALDLTGAERHRGLDVEDNRRLSVAEVLDRLAAHARTALDAVQAEGLRPVGATVALPGLVDAASGALLVAPNLGWNDVAVVDELRERLSVPGFPLAADNEANLAALAELWEGTARGFTDVLYVSGEIGVGGGIVLGGELFRGAQGFGGEFGHMTLDPGGKPCACGSRGCLETVAGLEALLEMAGLDPSSATTTAGSGEPVAALASRARAGDENALAALREGGRWLGIAIASAANLLNFQAVVLGGFFGQLSTWLAAPIARELEVHVLASEWAVPRVLPSTLGPEAAVRGAAAQSLRRVLADPMAAA